MKKIIIEPAQTDKVYFIRATELESFINCPYYFKYREFWESNYEAFYWWNVAHTLIEHKLLGVDVFDELRKGLNVADVLKLKKVNDLVEEKKLPKLKLVEYTMMLKFEFKEWSIILKWTLDWLTEDWKIIDIKTWKSNWQEKDVVDKYQAKIYSLLFNLLRNKKIWEQEFEYWIFYWENSIKFNKITLTVNLNEAFVEITQALKKYLQALEKDIRTPEKENINCKWCNLKSQCPLFSEVF